MTAISIAVRSQLLRMSCLAALRLRAVGGDLAREGRSHPADAQGTTSPQSQREGVLGGGPATAQDQQIGAAANHLARRTGRLRRERATLLTSGKEKPRGQAIRMSQASVISKAPAIAWP